MIPLVVSFYTGGVYRHLADRLAESCESYGLECEIEQREDLGSWVFNCGQKPTCILGMLEFYDRDLLWVDADAEFVSEPGDLDLDCDLGFHLTQNERHMSGTLLIRNTEASRVMLEAWIEQQALFPNVPDEDGMRVVIRGSETLRTAQLDPGYVYVYDVWKDRYPDCKPIILHKQASRLYIERARRFRPDRRLVKPPGDGIHPQVKEYELRG